MPLYRQEVKGLTHSDKSFRLRDYVNFRPQEYRLFKDERSPSTQPTVHVFYTV